MPGGPQLWAWHCQMVLLCDLGVRRFCLACPKLWVVWWAWRSCFLVLDGVLRGAVFVLENSFGYLTSRNMIYEPFSYFVDFNCGPSHVFVRFSLAFLFLIVDVPICLWAFSHPSVGHDVGAPTPLWAFPWGFWTWSEFSGIAGPITVCLYHFSIVFTCIV